LQLAALIPSIITDLKSRASRAEANLKKSRRVVMATNLVSLVMQFLTPDTIAKIASALGLDRMVAQKAITGAVPAILSGLAGPVLLAWPRHQAALGSFPVQYRSKDPACSTASRV
jgi:hypothetical protein